MLDNALKVLWLINGVLLLAVLLFIVINSLQERLASPASETRPTLKPVIEKEQPAPPSNKNNAQRLLYKQIQPVPGTVFRVLPISVQRLAEEKAPGLYAAPRGIASELNFSSSNDVNLIFLDIDYEYMSTLLNRKAFIHFTLSPDANDKTAASTDPFIKNMAHVISFEDSNKDGVLNQSDSADLYVSHIDGTNLVQATKNVHILDFWFINNNMELLIAYEERDSLQLLRQRRHFAKYNIARETLVDLPELHEQLLKVEQLLDPDTTNRLP